MRNEIVMPQMGESITTGTITKWHKNVGDKIELDEILLEISTDKVESEIPAPVGGTIVELLYKEGDTVDVQKLIAVIEDDPAAVGAAKPAAKEAPAAAPAPEVKAVASEAPAPATATVAQAPAPVQAAQDDDRFYTPLVKAMAKEAGIPISELASLKGSGAAGRVNRADFEAYVAGGRKGGASATTASASKAPSAPQSFTPAFKPGERVEIVPMDNMRKAIAKNMQLSKQVAPDRKSVV